MRKRRVKRNRIRPVPEQASIGSLFQAAEEDEDEAQDYSWDAEAVDAVVELMNAELDDEIEATNDSLFGPAIATTTPEVTLVIDNEDEEVELVGIGKDQDQEISELTKKLIVVSKRLKAWASSFSASCH